MNPNTGLALRVAFGDFPSWTEMIRVNVGPRYAADFVDFQTAILDDYAAIIPLQLTDYDRLRRYPQWRGSRFFHPTPETVLLCDDKLLLSQFLSNHGFEKCIPKLRGPGPPYPYIRKQRRGWWGVQCHIIEGPDDELASNNTDWFCQTLIPGEVEFATHILRIGGSIRYASTFSYKMSQPHFVRGAKATPLQTRFHRGCHYLDLFAKMLEKLDYEGTVCIDYKIHDRHPMLFEINPRFGGSLSLDITAYLDAYCAALPGP